MAHRSLRSWVACAALICAAALRTPPKQDHAYDGGSAAPNPILAVQGLIGRVLGAQYVPAFALEVIPPDSSNGHDVFELDAGSGSAAVTIRGNSGVAISSGLNWYLKYTCNASISWGRNGSGNQLASVPPPSHLPAPTHTRIASPVKYRYYMNVCTVGYSMVWWDIDAWMNEVDRAAMWGVNLPLGFTGSEWVWLQFYLKVGLNSTDITDNWMSGPAFLPWFRMGNVQRWGGPLDMAWISGQRDLQITLLAAMRSFGMMPVLPGFAGHVPSALVALYPDATFIQSADWNNFNATYGDDYLLEPTDPLFATIGAQYYQTLVAEYGTDHFYNMDMFNEMDPSSNDPAYLKQANAAIYKAMTDVDPQGVYVMQGWLFVNSPNFWQPAQVEAYLSGVPDAGMLILDLYTDSDPVWSKFESFYGKPWVWNMLQIFGGRRGIYGNLPLLAASIVSDRINSTMVGIGATPEAIEMTPITFDLLWEMGWRSTSPDLSTWLPAYAQRRYGAISPSINQALALLLPGAYSLTSNYGTTLGFCWIQNDPSLSGLSHDGTDPNSIIAALRLFVHAGTAGEVNATTSTYQYDLVDLARQALCNVFSDYNIVMGREYQLFQFYGVNSSAAVLPVSATLTRMIADLDTLLATNDNYLLGHWLSDAVKWSNTTSEFNNRMFNARNQVTLWGPNGEINDYAAKNGWAGLVGDYYGGRWAIHQDVVTASVLSGQQVDWTAYSVTLDAFKQAWNHNTSLYPTTPVGNGLATAHAVVLTYASGNHAAYTINNNTDATGVHVDIAQTWNTDVDVLMVLCSTDPSCLGFNSNGWLKNDTSTLIGSAGTTLYLKQ